MLARRVVTGIGQGKTFTIDFSKHEYTEGKAERELDHYTIYVYTPEMIVIEKLRAICQQMPEYPHRGQRTARARDFFDIYRAVTAFDIDLAGEDNLELARRIFAAKDVPLRLLDKIGGQREFHRPDWHAVTASVTGRLEEFDFYFDFVLAAATRLKALWVE